MDVLKVSLSRMTRHELLGYLKRVYNLIIYYPLQDESPLHSIKEDYENAMDYFDEVLKPATRSEYTKKIQQLRVVRLNQWAGLRNEVRAKCKIADEDISFPAEKVSAILDRYGNLRKITSVACDAAIENILQDIKKEIAESELTRLNIDDWITLLNNANEEYKDLVKVRSRSRQDHQPGSTDLARKKAFVQYHQFVNDIQYLSRLGSDEDKKITTSVIANMNSLIKEIKPILKSRATRSKNARQMEPEPEKELMDVLSENDQLPKEEELS